jgi:hypothetical protein
MCSADAVRAKGFVFAMPKPDWPAAFTCTFGKQIPSTAPLSLAVTADGSTSKGSSKVRKTISFFSPVSLFSSPPLRFEDFAVCRKS